MSTFFALLSRMKNISRWALMRNARGENLSEHSLEVAVLTHALVTLHNTRFGDNAGCFSAERAATLALFHDAPEVLTGDLPTPVKYHSPGLRAAYRDVELGACASLLRLLPEDLRPEYSALLCPGSEDDLQLLAYVKAADKLSALVKCIEERKTGNREFTRAEESLRGILNALHMPEVDRFIAEFLPAYEEPLDGVIGN